MGNDSFDNIIKSVKASVQNTSDNSTNTASPQIPIIKNGLSSGQRGANILPNGLSMYTEDTHRFTTDSSSGVSFEISTKNEQSKDED